MKYDDMNQANLDDRRGVDLCKCPDWRGARGLGVGRCGVVVEVENWNIVEVESVCLPSLIGSHHPTQT